MQVLRYISFVALVVASAAAGLALGLTLFQGSLSPKGEAARLKSADLYDVAFRACHAHWDAKVALRKRAGGSQAEVDRLKREMTAAFAASDRAFEELKPYYDMSQYQYELGIYYGKRCLLAAVVLGLFGGIGLVACGRHAPLA